MRADALKRQAYSIAAVRTLARARLPKPVFDFTDGAAEDETTLRRNEAAFDEISLLPHPLSGSAGRDLSLTLFGKQLALPVILGPTGLAGLMWPDGESASARAAKADSASRATANKPARFFGSRRANSTAAAQRLAGS